MNSLNKAQVIGNLTRDPELKKTTGGQSVCTVGVATNRYWTDSSGQKRDEAEYHNIVCWGKLAEICAEHLKKGVKVFFEGRLQTRNWEDEGGVKHYRTEIVANDMIILSPRNGGAGEDAYTSADNSSDTDSAGKASVTEASKTDSLDEIDPEDLPF